MTDPYGAPTTSDEILDEPETTRRLDQEASSILAEAEDRTFGSTTSVRQAVREDLSHGKEWAQMRAEAARDAIVDQPMTSTLYALGIGVLIGLLLRR
jgi:ElaB/YqjD/DUF883 family membrane-anchored ribosome-binding protein